jgi:hypothetical protein
VPAERHARMDQRDNADKIEPALAAEPTEKMEATEPTEPIDRIEPAEPMHRIEPAEPMDKIDPLDPMLRSEPAEPAGRGELSVFPMLGFSHPAAGPREQRYVSRSRRAARPWRHRLTDRAARARARLPPGGIREAPGGCHSEPATRQMRTFPLERFAQLRGTSLRLSTVHAIAYAFRLERA